MSFVSFGFLVLVVLTMTALRVIPRTRRPQVLLLFSYIFYCTWDWRMACVLFALTAATFQAAIQVERSQDGSRRAWAIGTVALLVIYLLSFKLGELLRLHWIFALGVSYYSFKLISYILDVYWENLPAERKFWAFGAYVAFYPQLVAGPIQRSGDFLEQTDPLSPCQAHIANGTARILLGFFKKLVVADQLAAFVGYGFNHAGSGGAGLLGLYLFPLQLYADFSGLADIAIGTALLFGIRSPENFNAPFSAANISDFWRRWHMTLTSWLKDYVFMPVHIATRDWGIAGLTLSIFINMMLIALWHGMTLLFVIFGLIQAMLMIADALTNKRRKWLYSRHPRINTVMKVLGPVVTYNMVALSLVLLRSHSFPEALAVYGSLAHPGTLPSAFLNAAAPPNNYAWVAFPAYILAEVGDYLRRWPPVLVQWPRGLLWSAYAALCVLALFVSVRFLAGQMDTNPFIYANF